jgi:guanylate kinase
LSDISESAPQRGSLIIVSAPSGGGKTSLTRALVKARRASEAPVMVSVSYTTRAPRPGEVDGQDYHFVDDVTFLDMVAKSGFLEHAEVFGRRYGTGRAVTEQLLADGNDVILDIDWQGARQVRTAVPGVSSVFILPPSREVLGERLKTRGQDSDEVVAQRMAAAVAEMSHYDEYDYLIVNDDFDRALADLGAVVSAARSRRPAVTARDPGLITRLLDSPAPDS